MNNEKKNAVKAYNILAFTMGLFSLATCWLWAYGINLFTALPCLLFGIFFCWKANREIPGNVFTKVNYTIFGLAMIIGLISFFLYL